MLKGVPVVVKQFELPRLAIRLLEQTSRMSLAKPLKHTAIISGIEGENTLHTDNEESKMELISV